MGTSSESQIKTFKVLCLKLSARTFPRPTLLVQQVKTTILFQGLHGNRVEGSEPDNLHFYPLRPKKDPWYQAPLPGDDHQEHEEVFHI